MLLLALLACTRYDDDSLVVITDPDHEALATAFVDTLPWHDISVVTTSNPARAADRAGGTRIALVADGDELAESYAIDVAEHGFVVHASDDLGLQYGLSEALEGLGFRFLHPYRTHVPDHLDAKAAILAHPEGAPVIGQRGLHLHTLHPIEGLEAFWMSDDPTEADQILTWAIANRTDEIQWVGLNDILKSGDDEWRARTRVLVEHAHARGLRVGLNVQLFASGSLQNAFVLLDEVGTPDEQAAAIDARLAVIADLGFDRINLSFGEFFGESPEDFVASVNLADARIQAAIPGVDVSATVHSGSTEELQVEYEGEEIMYYYLVKYCDPHVVPWVHTTMFYDLTEDVGGAYGLENYDDHRAFLHERLVAGDPVAYNPESAYWVAFDNSVPQAFPLYVRTRWTDLSTEPGLPAHQLFSTGWEWTYWLNDRATQRAAYYGPGEDWRPFIEDAYAPWGEDGAAVAAAMGDLADLQHEALIVRRLVAYLAGRDLIIDFGAEDGITSQPQRPSFEQVVAMSEFERATFWTDVVQPLGVLADSTGALAATLPDPGDDPYLQEARDSLEVDQLRAEFAAHLWNAIVQEGDGLDSSAELAAAEATLDEAKIVVERRVASPLDPNGGRWYEPTWANPTIYPRGYSSFAGDLCYWRRELVQAQRLLDGSTESVPACAL